MVETKELAKRESAAQMMGGNVANEWQVMKEQASVMLKSGFLPPSIRTAEQCLAIFLTGKELGIGFMESVRSINVIQGKPTISPQLMLALANRTKELKDQKIDATDKRALVTIERKGRTPITVEFGVKEATDLGLMTKDNYRKQPKTMFTWRAVAAAMRLAFPDVVLGMYTPEEMGATVAVTEAGEMTIEHEPEKPIRINQESGEVLIAAAKAKGITTGAIARQANVQRLSEITVDQLPGLMKWIELQALPAEIDKEFDAIYENLLKAGVAQADLGDYLDSLKMDRATVTEHLRKIVDNFKKEALPQVFLNKAEAVRKAASK